MVENTNANPGPSLTLRLAAIYNIVWGAFIVLSPLTVFNWAGLEVPRYPEIWQCVGMIVGVYGVGYWFAANNPRQHWVIILVGLMGKIFGPIGFIKALYTQTFNMKFGVQILFNDLIWWIPFTLILLNVWKQHQEEQDGK